MSELAFNVNGEPFEVPPTAARWRVKKMKPKGAPEVAFGRDGIPLTLPIDADMDDLRQEARGAEGKYRLDPIDDQGQPIAGAPFGYVYVYADEASELAPVTRRAPAESVIAEALRMNTELASKVVDRFPMMVEAVAGLIRAADGAGLPARAPRALPEPTVDEDDQDDDAEAPTKASGWAGVLETLLPMVTPAIAAAIAGGKLQIPGGLGALFDCRRAVPKGSAAAARTASTPGAVPAPGPHDPAPAGAHSAARGPRASTTAAPRSERASRPPSSHQASAEPTPFTEAPGAELATAAEPGTTPPEELPTLDPASLAHFVAIQSALSLSERMWAQAMATELTPAELRAWLAELLAVSVPDGVAKIRAVLAANGHGNAHQDGGAS